MPLYEYQCDKCKNVFELLRRVNNVDDGLRCPNCHSTRVERQISTFATGGCSASGSRGFT